LKGNFESIFFHKDVDYVDMRRKIIIIIDRFSKLGGMKKRIQT
jgi:hypothetical protein